MARNSPQPIPTKAKGLKCARRKCPKQTAALWPPIRVAFGWVHQVALIPKNETELLGTQVGRRLSGSLGVISRWKAQVGVLIQALEQFLKVTRSY
ncbi:MAG TPA: hypothetical protein V6D16_12805 [Candidatus Obscuribacterales bacterium]